MKARLSYQKKREQKYPCNNSKLGMLLLLCYYCGVWGRSILALRWDIPGLPSPVWNPGHIECCLLLTLLCHCSWMNAQSIYSVLLDWLKKKDLQCSKLIGMGFDGAATFVGKKSGVQARLKKHAPHSVFVHCHCHKLQLVCVQSANSTEGIKHVYTTLTTLWKCFHYSPKRCQNLKEIQ